jgi:hypothetical protein
MALCCGTDARNPTDVLPPSLVREILRRLPADQLARAASVSRAWRCAVADPALWRRLDLSCGSGMTCRFNDAALRAAAARARGGLEALDVTGRWFGPEARALRDVVSANAATLRNLRTVGACEVSSNSSWEALLALLAAGPALQVLEATVTCYFETARLLLRNEPPFGPVRLRSLLLACDADEDFSVWKGELIAHPTLKRLRMAGYFSADNGHYVRPTPDALEALVDAALALQLTCLHFDDCYLSPDAAPALARLLRSTTLEYLHLQNEDDSLVALLDTPAAWLLSSGLRANNTLQSLTLQSAHLWRDAGAALVLLSALIGHSSLRSLDFRWNMFMPDGAAPAVGALLGALVAADAPLEELEVSFCGLGDKGLGPLCDALPRNAHLRKLVMENNEASAEFARERLLPAVRANTSLRELAAGDCTADVMHDAETEAMQFVKAREAARMAAQAAAARGCA